MRVFLLPLCALPLTGCLFHEARITADPPAGADAKSGFCAIGVVVRDGSPQDTRHGPLPYDIPVEWWVHPAGGALQIGRARVESPLPWWQRFPIDLAVDLWPGKVTVVAAVTIVPRPVVVRTAAEITAEARAHGYAP